MKTMFSKNFNDLDLIMDALFPSSRLNDIFISNVSSWKQEQGNVEWDKENEEYNITISVPGFNKEEIKITVDSKGLIITGEIKDEKIKTQLGERKISYVFSKYDLDPESVKAELINGILSIKLKKLKDKNSKVIEIN
jgi:HSP20 family molecular chaperone IbpA